MSRREVVGHPDLAELMKKKVLELHGLNQSVLLKDQQKAEAQQGETKAKADVADEHDTLMELHERKVAAEEVQKQVGILARKEKLRETASSKLSTAKHELKDAEAAKQTAFDELMELAEEIQTGKTPSLPIMHKTDDGKPSPDADVSPGARWRGISLAAVGLPKVVVNCLGRQDITNLGGLYDWQQDGGNLTTLKGVGEETAVKARRALIEWAQRNPELKPPGLVNDE